MPCIQQWEENLSQKLITLFEPVFCYIRLCNSKQSWLITIVEVWDLLSKKTVQIFFQIKQVHSENLQISLLVFCIWRLLKDMPLRLYYKHCFECVSSDAGCERKSQTSNFSGLHWIRSPEQLLRVSKHELGTNLSVHKR